MPLDDVHVVPIFFGMMHLACPECERLSDTIEIGIIVHDCEVCPQDLYGVIRYESCGCIFSCVHLAAPVAALLEHNDATIIEFADLCELIFAEHECDEPDPS